MSPGEVPPPRPPGPRTRSDLPWAVPSWIDPVVTAATGAIGGPLGRYAVVGARGLAGVAAAITLLGSLALALGVWQKGHCLMKGWNTPDQFWRACYSDLPVVHVSSALADRGLPWAADGGGSTQPVLSGVVMWLLAQISPRTGQDLAAQQWVMVLWILVTLVLVALSTVALVALSPRHPWSAAHLAVSPVLMLLALVSTDLLGVTLTLLGWWAWRRDRPWVAGLLLGTALLLRPFPLLVLAAMVLVARREQRTLAGLQAVVGTALGALAILLPLVAVEPAALTAAEQWWSQPAGYGALQMVPRLIGLTVPTQVTGAIALGGWVAALAAGIWAARRPGRRAGVVQLSALMLLVVALTAATLPVQSGLWVLPFLALSGRAWWEHLVWALGESLAFLATWLHIAFTSDAGRGLPGDAYALAVVLRAAAWAWLLWRVYQSTARLPGLPRAQRPTEVPTSSESSVPSTAWADRASGTT